MIGVLVVDDHAMVRAGFGALLAAQDDLEVRGEAADGDEAIRVVRLTRPDVVLMDVRMPGRDGLSAAREILGAREPPRVVMLTTFDVDDYVYEALRIGASGFLLKDAPPDELVRAVRVAAAGDALLAPTVTRRLIERFALNTPTPDAAERLLCLTAREREVLALIARGRSNAEIAESLIVAEQTVKSHIGRIFTKLDLRDRAQAVVVAYEGGLVVPGGRPETGTGPSRRAR